MILMNIPFLDAFITLYPAFIGIAIFFLLILGGFLWLVYIYLNFERKSRLVELRIKTQERTLPLQLNAYERIILFLERLNPSNLLMRNYEPGMKPRDLGEKSIADIRAEYEHNLTQQIYVSAESWDVLKKVKDETILLINIQLNQCGEHITGLEFCKLVFERMSKMEVNPYDYSINTIKKEVQQLF
jgi:hypothetical protein